MPDADAPLASRQPVRWVVGVQSNESIHPSIRNMPKCWSGVTSRVVKSSLHVARARLRSYVDLLTNVLVLL